MPSSYVTFTGNSSTTGFSFAGIDDYLSSGFLKVYLDNVLQTSGYTLNASTEIVTFTTAPATGVTVKIARETPSSSAGFKANIVDFADGSVLTATDLDNGLKGLLHIVQEANDTGSGALGKTEDGLAWDAKGFRITNGANGLDPLDFVTKSQLDAAQVFGGGATFPQSWTFTGTGSQLSFTLATPDPNSSNADMFLVEVGGVLQRPTTDYTITGSVLSFTAGNAPANGVGIRVRNFGVSRAIFDSLPNGSVIEQYIADGAVTTPKLADNAVTAAKLANDSVDTAAIQNLAVTGAKIANATIAEANLSNLAVTNAKLAADAVTNVKIADGTIVGSAKISASSISGDRLEANTIGLDKLKTTGFASVSGSDRFLRVSGASGTLSAANLDTIPITGAVSGSLNFGGIYKCLNMATPSASTDGATKAYVDSVAKQVIIGRLPDLDQSNTSFVVTDMTGTSTIFDGIIYTGLNLFAIGIRPKSGQGTWAIQIGGWAVAGSTGAYQGKFLAGVTSSTALQDAALLTLTSVNNKSYSGVTFVAIKTA
jgi:hypothetical protein